MESSFAANATSRGQTVRYIASANEIINKMKSPCLILISNTNFEVLTLDNKEGIKSYSWFDLSKISNTSEALFLSFGQISISFVCSDLKTVYSYISDIIPRILTRREMRSIGFINTLNKKPTGKSVILRLETKNNHDDSKVMKTVKNYLTDLTRFSKRKADLTELSDLSKTVPLVLDVLPLIPSVKELIVPSSFSYDAFLSLSYFVAETSSIEHISIKGVMTKSYEKFLQSIESNKDLKLSGLTFTNSNMSMHNLRLLENTIKQKNIKTIGFHNAIPLEKLSLFCRSFLKNVSKTIKYLNLDNTKGLDIESFIPFCGELEVLSLSNLNVDVVKAMKLLTEKNVPKLKCINLSNNFCIEKSPKSLRLSPSINSVMIDNIKWSKHTLPELLQTLTHSSKTGLYLSVANADTTTNEWIRVFNYFRQTKFVGMCSFVWRGNPIHSRLFDFLKRNNDLVHLDLGGCFIQDEKYPIESFLNYIETATNLKSLVVSGNSVANIGTYIPRIVSAAEKAGNIQYLDISSQKGGDSTLSAVSSLINGKSKIDVVVFDGSEPTNDKLILNLMRSSTKTKTCAALSFPSNDIDNLLKQGRISQKDIDDVFKHIMFNPCKSSSPFDCPYYIFKEEEGFDFPNYISNDIERSNLDLYEDQNNLTLEGMESENDSRSTFNEENNKIDITKEQMEASTFIPPQKFIKAKTSSASKTSLTTKILQNIRETETSKSSSPKEKEANKDDEVINKSTAEKEPTKPVSESKGSSASKSSSKRKDSNASKSSSTKKSSNSKEKEKSKASSSKDSSTSKTDASKSIPADNQSKGKRKQIHHHHHHHHHVLTNDKDSNTNDDENLKTLEFDQIIPVSEEPQTNSTIDEGDEPTTTEVVIPHTKTVLDEISWTMPIKYLPFKGMHSVWSATEKTFSIDGLLIELHKSKK